RARVATRHGSSLADQRAQATRALRLPPNSTIAADWITRGLRERLVRGPARLALPTFRLGADGGNGGGGSRQHDTYGCAHRPRHLRGATVHGHIATQTIGGGSLVDERV